MNDVLKSGYYSSNLGYDEIDWFVDEIFRLEKNCLFFETTKKVFVITEEDEEHYRKKILVNFVKKKL